ncbi:MAG TPA: hypothetical protein VJ417_04615, partial [Candidatus Glassbacteria bacterium]|nr:hypothetical protein [Candidatus Glassbacteria bacterium]
PPVSKGKAMRLTFAQLIFPAALISLLFLSQPAISQQQNSQVPAKPDSPLFKKGVFDVKASREFFDRVVCGPSLEGINFPLRFISTPSVAPTADSRNVGQKLNDTFLDYINYPGGTLVCEAVQLGLDFLTYSHGITTYGTTNFHTGFDFIGKSFVRTGIFYNF